MTDPNNANDQSKRNANETNNVQFNEERNSEEDESSAKKKEIPNVRDTRWYRFEILTQNSAILRGSFAMNDMHFKQRSRGNQATSCSVVSIVFGRLFEPKNWTKKFVDSILEYGDKLYRISVTRNRVSPGVYLTTNLVYPEFYIDDYKCLICTEDGIVHGNLFSATIGCPDFTEGLQRFFKLNESGVITAQGSSFAVWRHPKAGFLYYDPAPCGPDGLRSKEGVACVIRFKKIDEMAVLILENLDRRYDSRYCIDKVNVLRVNLISRGVSFENGDQFLVDKNVLRAFNPIDIDDNKLDCTRPAPKSQNSSIVTAAAIHREPLTITISNYNIDARLANQPLISFKSLDTGYPYYDMEVNVPSTFKELHDRVAILHGWTHESSEMYKGKGAQNVANCVAAVAMKTVSPVKTWLRPKLDDILVQGDALYAKVKAEKPTIKSMTAADLNDTSIKIEDRSMIIDVDLLTVVGTISSAIPEVLSLRQALDEFFLVNKDGVIECSSMALAIWAQDDYYYTFDPRQCDASGVRIIQEKGKTGKASKKGDAGTADKKVKGKCCVMRFPDLDSMLAIFMRNIDATKKNDRFVVRNIAVIDDVPGVRAWKEFQPGELGKTWILQGGISSIDEHFEPYSQGAQGIAMPIVGLINAVGTSPDKWTKDTIDRAINDGDNYYNWCVPPEEEETRVLVLGNAKKTLYVNNRKVKIELNESLAVGHLAATDNAKTPNLSQGIAQFFENHQHGVVVAKDLAVAVWKSEEEQKDKTKVPFYYLYDANPRDRLGHRNLQSDEAELKACVARAVNPEELARLIEKNIDPGAEGSNEFAVHEIKVLSTSEPMTDEEIELDKATPVKPELNYYSEIGEDGGCLNASFDQANELMFKHQTRDKQQAANCLVALAMRKLYNPHLWYREVIDDILKVGDQLTQRNSENLPAVDEEETEEGTVARDYLLPTEIAEEFDIGVNRVSISLEEELASGGMSDLTTNLEEFFVENSMGVFRQGKTMLPVWKEGEVYFTMDPRGRDANGIPKEKDGAATVLWFTRIPALASSLKLSVEKPDGDFAIDAVTLVNSYESRVAEGARLKRTTSAEDLWHRFPKKSEGVWELEGNVKADDERFDEENRKRQTAAIAVMSIIFSKAYEPRQWSSEVVDEVVITGDKLHSQTVERLGGSSAPRISEMTKEIFLSNRRIDLTIQDSVEAGNLAGIPPKVQDIEKGLEKFFQRFSSGALTLFDDLNIAVWKDGHFYYCLLPFASFNGEGEIEGQPRIVRFADLTVLGQYIKGIVGKEGDYVITSIDVVDWDKRPPWKFDPSPAVRPSNLPPFNAYHKLYGVEGEARAILHGKTHQGSDIFPEMIRNKQTAANCVVALGMSVVKNPVTWTEKTLDEILVMGTNVHHETSKARPAKEKFKPHDIVRVFHVGVNVMTADVEESTISGPVAVPPPEPEIKGKGKTKKKKAPKPKKAKKGKVKRLPPPPPSPIYLEDGLPKFFEKNNAGVLVTGRYMTAIWKYQGVYFMYDPRSRGPHGLADDNGTSCVMWFACLQPLYDIVFANIDDGEKYGRYNISRVIMKTTLIEPLPCPASFRPILECNLPSIPVASAKKTPTLDVEIITEYKIVDDEVAVLRGTLHMNDRVFDVKSRGLQSCAIAAVAIVVGTLHVPSTWTSELVDAVLKYGDLLHTDTTRAIRPGARNLSPVELLTVFIIGDFRANIRIHRHTTAGILHVYDLLQALSLFFRTNCSGILHTANIAVAVMQHYGKFYLFDPLARNEFGRATYEGTACVVKCQSIERLAWHFVTNCNYKVPTVYTLNAVNVLSLRFFGDTRSECPPFCDKR